MSKATDYKDKLDGYIETLFLRPSFHHKLFEVTNGGNLDVHACDLAPEQALELAAWIIETFGEKK